MVKETHVTLSLPKGMKQTEIGLIPEEWDVKNLGQIGLFTKGKGIRKDEANSGIFPAIRYGEIYTKHNNIITKFYSFISEEVANNSVEMKKGDILFAGSGETKEDIGKSVSFIDDIKAYVGGDVVILRPNNKHNSSFLGYLLNSQDVQKQKAENGQGDAVVHIYANNLKDIKIPLPPLAEQEAIAAALSDCDAWIESLEAVIAKKRLIKQGAMQKLLTPKDDWEVKKLGELTEIYTGKKNNQDKIENGTFPFFVRSQKIERINSYSFDGEAILVPGEGNLGSIFHYINGKFDFHQRVYKVSDFKGIDGKYTYWYFRMYFGQHAMQNTVKATVDSIRLPTLLEFEVSFPKFLTEQTRIATVLSDMDSELDALGQKLNKARQIKQGMMQELLTGRVRLV